MKSPKLPEGKYAKGIDITDIPAGLMHVPGKVWFLCDRLDMPYRRAIVGQTFNTWKKENEPRFNGIIIDVEHFALLKREMDKAGYVFEGEAPKVPKERQAAAPRQRQSKRIEAINYSFGVPVWKLPEGVVHVRGNVQTKCRSRGIPFVKAIVGFRKASPRAKPDYDGVIIDKRHLPLLADVLSADTLRLADELNGFDTL